jgi:nucleoid-associated protein YgaU
MGILDFMNAKSPSAPAPAGATDTSAASPEALKAEIASHGLDVSRIEIAVDGSKVTLSGAAATTADSEKIALAVGNTKGVTQVVNNIVADAPHAEAVFYTVVHGDSLWKIAERFYGDGAKYTVIFEANRPPLKDDPNILYPGWVLRIPKEGTEGDAEADESAQQAPQPTAQPEQKKSGEVAWKAPTE